MTDTETDDENVQIDAEEDKEYDVEAIRTWRYNYKLDRREYLIKWQGYPENDNTWEPIDNLNCPRLLEKFEDSLSLKEAANYFSESCKNLTGFQRKALYEGCIGAEEAHQPNSENCKFYCKILFDDNDEIEPITVEEFLEHEPEDCWKFLEQRMYFAPRSKMYEPVPGTSRDS